MVRFGKFRVAAVGVAAFLLVCVGIAYGLNKQDSGSDVPIRDGIPLVVDESPTPDQVKEIGRFPMLEEPTEEKLAELSQTALDWIRFGLDQSRGEGAGELSSLATVRSDLGSDIVMFTTGDSICFVASESARLRNGGCNRLDRASDGAFSTGETGTNDDFYVIGILPGDLRSIEVSPRGTKLQLYGNLYEGVVSPESNLVLEGKSESGETVITERIPIQEYAGG